jgi:adenylate cyclase
MASSRRLAAIMFTDIVGYTALMGKDEVRALALLKRNIQIQRPLIESFNGDLLKEMGDGILASFPTVSDAVYCAGAIQNACEAEGDLSLRIGIHLGEVVFEGHDVFGDGVNIASRIEAIAPSGSIWVSESVYRNTLNKKGIATTFVREAQLKNVSEPVRIYEAKVENIEAAISVKPLPAAKTNPRKGVLTVIGIMTILVLGYFGKSYFTRTGEVDVEIIEKSIAVLPFTNESSNQENLYFCNGIMEGVLDHLAKIPELRVLSRSSVEQYRNDRPSMKEMADELGVMYLVEGSVQRIDDRAIIFAQLIHAESDKHLWSNPYERNLIDIFAVQAEITQSIADELHTIIAPDVKDRIEAVPTTDIAAYDLYLRGRNYHYAYNSSLDITDLESAEGLYKEALRIDSTFALAYVGMGLVNLSRTGFAADRSINESQYIDSVGQFANKALRFDDELAEAYHLRGLYHSRMGEFDQATTDQTKSTSLNPNMAEAYLSLARLASNDPQRAVINIKKAMALEKDGRLTASSLSALGFAYLGIGAFQKAEQYFRESIRLQPDYFAGYQALWWLSLVQGKFEEALEFAMSSCSVNSQRCLGSIRANYTFLKEFDKALEYYEKSETSNKKLGLVIPAGDIDIIYIYQQTGKQEEARQLLEKTVAYWKDRNTNESYYRIGAAYAAMGDLKNALINLKKYDFNGGFYSFISYCPIFESLWDNEEFKDLVKKLNEEKAKIREEIFALEATGEL